MTTISQSEKLPINVLSPATLDRAPIAGSAFWIDAYRVLTGLILTLACVHYATSAHAISAHAISAPPALGATQPASSDLTSIIAAQLRHLSPASSWFLAAAFACASTLAVLPRVSAACLVGLLSSMPIAASEAAFDVPVMSLVALWLVMLPVGRSFRFRSSRKPAPGKRLDLLEPFPRGTIELCLCSFALAYMNVFSWRRAFPGWEGHTAPALATATLVALWLLAPRRPFCFFAALLQVGFHLALALSWGHVLGNALLATTAFLHLARAESRTAPPLFDASVVCALALTCVACLFMVGQLLGASIPTETAGIVLHNLGPLVSVYAFN